MDTELQKEAYYARIVPVLGEGLRAYRIGVIGVAAVAGAVERLAGCRALRWDIADKTWLGPAHPLVRATGRTARGRAGQALLAGLMAHNRWEDGWTCRTWPTLTAAGLRRVRPAWRRDPPDLLLGGGDAGTLARIAALARALARPALLVLYCAGDDPTAACLALLPGDAGQGRDLPDLFAALGHPALLDPARLPPGPAAWHAWAAANGLAALLARALLLHGTPHAAPDLDRLLWDERRTAIVLGHLAWPWAIHYVNLATAGPRPRAECRELITECGGQRSQRQAVETRPEPTLRPQILGTRYSALVVGCGSLGSLAARALAASGAVDRLVLVDGERVDAANPVRQWFHTDQVGQAKAWALARNLAPLCRTRAFMRRVVDTPDGRAAFRRLLRETQPDVVVLATGDDIDYMLARLCRAQGIRHVVGRCYPRARYFEMIVVDGRRGPCFGCLRGHLYTGPAPPPTPEERLRYAPVAAPGALQAEPATIVESGRAADVLAALAGALAAPRAARPPWLATLIAAGQTCLIGANSVVPGAEAGGAETAWAYGIPLPGQVVAFGRAQVMGAGTAIRCLDCGRRLRVVAPPLTS